jgi:hypothetical protein
MDQPWAAERRRPLPEERLLFISLTPDRATAPHSSLVHMIDALIDWYGSTESRFVGLVGAAGWEVEGAMLRDLLEQRSSKMSSESVVLLGTAFSFVHLLDELERTRMRLQLPPGSRVMETGGYKGRSRTVTKAELHRMISERLGVAPAQIISEYGMSELSSQAYDAAITPEPRPDGVVRSGARRVFRFPPSCRTTPASSSRLGERGIGDWDSDRGSGATGG